MHDSVTAPNLACVRPAFSLRSQSEPIHRLGHGKFWNLGDAEDLKGGRVSALPQFTMAGAVSLNVRIEPEISTALLRASMDRKIQRLDPFTQRDIVAEALAEWLKNHGYLA